MCIRNILKRKSDQVPSYGQVLVPCALQRRAAKFTQGRGSYVEYYILSQAVTLLSD